MKAIIAIILFGVIAPAQNRVNHESKTQHCEMDLFLGHCAVRSLIGEEPSQNGEIARLYKRSNTRIKKALNFDIKYTKTKLA